MQNKNHLGEPLGCLQCGTEGVKLYQFFHCAECLREPLANARKIIDRFRSQKRKKRTWLSRLWRARQC